MTMTHDEMTNVARLEIVSVLSEAGVTDDFMMQVLPLKLLTWYHRGCLDGAKNALTILNNTAKPDIDLRGQPGDTRFECPVCHWGVTLKPDGVAEWTNNGTIVPRCNKDDVVLVRTEYAHQETR